MQIYTARIIKKVLLGERCQKMNHKIDGFKEIFEANKLKKISSHARTVVDRNHMRIKLEKNNKKEYTEDKIGEIYYENKEKI